MHRVKCTYTHETYYFVHRTQLLYYNVRVYNLRCMSDARVGNRNGNDGYEFRERRQQETNEVRSWVKSLPSELAWRMMNCASQTSPNESTRHGTRIVDSLPVDGEGAARRGVAWWRRRRWRRRWRWHGAARQADERFFRWKGDTSGVCSATTREGCFLQHDRI